MAERPDNDKASLIEARDEALQAVSDTCRYLGTAVEDDDPWLAYEALRAASTDLRLAAVRLHRALSRLDHNGDKP